MYWRGKGHMTGHVISTRGICTTVHRTVTGWSQCTQPREWRLLPQQQGLLEQHGEERRPPDDKIPGGREWSLRRLQCGITNLYRSVRTRNLLRCSRPGDGRHWRSFWQTVYSTFNGFCNVLKQLNALPTRKVDQIGAPSVVIVRCCFGYL
jgi:hypothetical protein